MAQALDLLELKTFISYFGQGRSHELSMFVILNQKQNTNNAAHSRRPFLYSISSIGTFSNIRLQTMTILYKMAEDVVQVRETFKSNKAFEQQIVSRKKMIIQSKYKFKIQTKWIYFQQRCYSKIPNVCLYVSLKLLRNNVILLAFI